VLLLVAEVQEAKQHLVALKETRGVLEALEVLLQYQLAELRFLLPLMVVSVVPADT
jgi:hypothetical protein